MDVRLDAGPAGAAAMDGVIGAMQRTAKKGELFEHVGINGLAVRLWLVLIVFNLVFHHDAIAALRYPDPDDAMRLAQVRDLIAGQGWFDSTQHRVNPLEGGGLMHWSRFVDASVAALILLLQPVLGDAAGERWAIALYPQLLILPLFLLFGRILTALGDRHLAVAGLLIAFTGTTFLQYFIPMRIDHHGWQLLLSVAMVWIALRPASLANGLLGAAIMTLHIEISLEGVPYLALFGALFAFDWLRDPGTARRLTGFALGLVGFPALWLLATRGMASTLTVFCDTFSLPYAAAVAASAAVLAAWTLGPAGLSQSLPRRLCALAVAGAAGAAVFVVSGPQCLAGPFGELDPLVRHYWYDGVFEGRPLWAQHIAYGIVYLVPTVVGLAALGFAWRKSRNGPFAENWTRVAAIILGSALMSIFVTRMGATTHAILIPAFAAMALGLWRWSRTRPSRSGRIAAALLIVAALPGVDAALGLKLTRAAAGQAPVKAMASNSCPNDANIVALSRAPATHVFAPIDIGPALLVRTRHSVVATGHHRNEGAMRRIITAFIAEPAAAEPIVRAEKARYLVLCRDLPEMQRFASEAPRGLAARLVRGEPVRWLAHDARLSSGSLEVYRILPAVPAADTKTGRDRHLLPPH